MLVLGIETSCDETSAALVKDDRCILSQVTASSLKLHNNYGGVI
ncbi:MAG: tRNA (adenosine(37)-N6)-threonylcarbamoyltransferase complex transferase subunit TsaD, partial [Candidatus Omnitrophica bacterium]|nr:tRNA (adenosine(37)-N6)-threonylcarbamoyltransferase complex transferase subunit TsaD [Candidatus Omnitrophota bacterium]